MSLLVRPAHRALLAAALLISLLAASAAFASPARLRPVQDPQLGPGLGQRFMLAAAPEGEATLVWDLFKNDSWAIRSETLPRGGIWSEPVDLVTSAHECAGPQVAATASGEAVAVWSCVRTGGSIIEAASRPAGGNWSAPVALSPPRRYATRPRVATSPSGEAVVIWSSFDGNNLTVESAARPTGGTWSPAVAISPLRGESTKPRIAIDASGEAVAVWERSAVFNYGRIEASSRPTGDAWTRPREISRGPGESPALALNASGKAVAVWESVRQGKAIIRSASARDGRWRGPLNIAVPGGAHSPQVAIGPGGEAIAIWRSLADRREVIRAARMPHASKWSATQAISNPSEATFTPLVSTNSAGETVALWSRMADSHYAIEAASIKPGSHWSRPTDLSTQGNSALYPAFALADDGYGVAAWETSPHSGEGRINTVIRPAP